MNRMAEHLMTDTIAYSTFRRDASGDPVLNRPKRARARVESTTDLVRGADGNDQAAKHKVVTLANTPLDCLVWINDGDTTNLDQSLRPITISGAKFPNGDRLFEIIL